MDGFTYHNIFQTKGIEYIIIIAFLLLLIPFWLFISRQKQIVGQIRRAVGFTFGLLRIQRGVMYCRNHTWTHLGKNGTAEVGLDDFLLHLTGGVTISRLKKAGEDLVKGELLAEIERDGKLLHVLSPVSGKILATNIDLQHEGMPAPEETYKSGWIYRIQPAAWAAETRPYYIGEEAMAWFRGEIDRLKDFMAAQAVKNQGQGALIVLQEGGELCEQPLAVMPEEVWQDFQKEFMDQV